MVATGGLHDDLGLARALIRSRFADEVTDLQPLEGGEFSRAFGFAVAGQNFVLRMTPDEDAAASYAKDAYAWRNLASARLPIPRVVTVGRAGGHYFAISERAPGRRVEEASDGTRAALLPALLDVVDALAVADTSASRGYGAWNASGDGEAPSWRQYLVSVMDDWPTGYYRGWHALFRTSFLERELYEMVYRRLLRLVDACPEERALVHADLHFDNILTDGRRITGVVDWGNACYGDPLYDVAWLGRANANDAPFVNPELLRERFGSAPRFRERRACYECYQGLDDLRFYAKTGRRERYDAIRHRLLNSIGAIDVMR